jgi:O-antigen/teichoic acid export membrane protein
VSRVQPWRDRALVLAGRGATGLLPVAMLSFAARTLGLRATGNFATALALAFSVAEVADFFSERHVPRVALAAPGDERHRARLEAFNSLRLIALAAGCAIGALVLWQAADRADLAVNLLVLSSSAWVLFVKTQYANALSERRYGLLGAGPLLSLTVAVACCALLLRTTFHSLWAVGLALHAGKAAEALVLRLNLPGTRLSVAFRDVRAEWRATRYLLFQGVLSAANARLIIPLMAVAAGTVVAGILSIGLALLSLVSLSAVAMSVPAYRQAVEAGALHTLGDGFHRTKRDLLAAVAAGAMLATAIALCGRLLLHLLFHADGDDVYRASLLIVASGPLETMSLFAGTYYHACLADRRLFAISAFNALAGWVCLIAGVRLGGVAGMGWGFLVSRAVGTAALYAPIVRSARQPGPAPATLARSAVRR